MIEEVKSFLASIEHESPSLANSEEIIKILVSKGANQMSCTKVIKLKLDLSLKKADEIVSNSKHWVKYKMGNEILKGNFLE